MNYAQAVGVLLSCWAFGYVLGYQIRQIWDAVNAC
jgi:hypothetical protein